MRKFTSVVDANPFLAARSCLVADTNSCILVLQSFLVSSSQTVVTASSVSASGMTIGKSNFTSINCSFRFVAAFTSLCTTYKETNAFSYVAIYIQIQLSSTLH